MTRRTGRGAAAFLVALTLGAVALAQSSLPTRRTGIHWRGGVPRLDVNVADLATPASVRRSIESGIARRISVSVQGYRTGASRPISSRSYTCTVTYDIFERSFLVRRGRRSTVVATYEEVLERCLRLQRYAAGAAEDFAPHAGRDVFFAVRAEFNPIDRRRCRQLLRSSGSSQDPIGPIVVNIVRREICEAERAKTFRTQAVRVPAPGGGR